MLGTTEWNYSLYMGHFLDNSEENVSILCTLFFCVGCGLLGIRPGSAKVWLQYSGSFLYNMYIILNINVSLIPPSKSIQVSNADYGKKVHPRDLRLSLLDLHPWKYTFMCVVLPIIFLWYMSKETWFKRKTVLIFGRPIFSNLSTLHIQEGGCFCLKSLEKYLLVFMFTVQTEKLLLWFFEILC